MTSHVSSGGLPPQTPSEEKDAPIETSSSTVISTDADGKPTGILHQSMTIQRGPGQESFVQSTEESNISEKIATMQAASTPVVLETDVGKDETSEDSPSQASSESEVVPTGTEVEEEDEGNEDEVTEAKEHERKVVILSSEKDEFSPNPVMPLPENIRITTAPIPAAELREYFTNKAIVYVIDYKNSRMKATTLLTFLSNLSIPTDVQVDLENYDEYNELLGAFFAQRSVLRCHGVTALAGEVLMHFSGVPRELHSFSSPVSDEFMVRFCEEHAEILAIWRIFLDSMVLYMSMNLMRDNIEAAEDVVVVDDKDAIGHNVVNLIRAPDYLRTYFATTELSAQVYFKQQFNEYMFGNRNLAYYFLASCNTVNHLLKHNPILLEEGKLLEQINELAKTEPKEE